MNPHRLCSQLARPLCSGLGPLRQADVVEIWGVGRRDRYLLRLRNHDALHHLALRARPLEPLPTLDKPSDSVVLRRTRVALRLQLRDLCLQL